MKTSWEKSSQWYNKLVGQQGHYFHEHVIIPKILTLLGLTESSKVLDIGSGQGVLARFLPKQVSYIGIDLSPTLIATAQRQDHNKHHQYLVADATKSLPTPHQSFTHVIFLLSLQNIERADAAIQQASHALMAQGTLVVVLNHPCFRIPRQSGWGTNSENKLQYRYINRYLSDLQIPIQMHPGQDKSQLTWSFHHALSTYTSYLFHNGFLIEQLEEWTSDKHSEGKHAKKENRSRSEIPLFLALKAIKK